LLILINVDILYSQEISRSGSAAMIKLHEQYLIDNKGKKRAVVVDIKTFEKVVAILEDYEDIKDFDERITNPEWLSAEEFRKKANV